ncbi:hypothetical protein FRC0043_02362 [Corynebacterium belfantii]|nr:hypothetical protein FRC0043_02362 [Corynebacterium belfantii]
MLAYFDIGASNGPVAAINGRLEHLRGIALGFKKPQPLHLAVPNPLRTTTRQNQRTLKPERPIYAAENQRTVTDIVTQAVTDLLES